VPRLLLPALCLACAWASAAVQAVTASNPAVPDSTVVHPPWSRAATIYEVNLRQYTREGTLAAFEAELPRLKRMGVDIVWLMPLHPIGAKHRKGTLGSYYAVRDYTTVNPEFGTLADLKRLVGKAHALGMKVILDWVANHTAWDHPWVAQHPDWYKKNERGEIYPVTFGEGATREEWTDVVALDYGNKAVWRAMTDAMAFWLREVDIDGFRCDVAGLVPTPFWEQAREALDRIKPVFMLAEWSDAGLHRKAFDMTYDWDLYELLKGLARGRAGADDVRAYLAKAEKSFPPDAYRMAFTGNHDTNSWHGSDTELYGAAFRVMAVLAATLHGMPLLYGGQEAPFDKRLQFFEKDPIAWKQRELEPLYTELLRLKHAHPALWNGAAGAPARVLPQDNPAVLAFERRLPADAVTVIANLSAQPQRFRLPGGDTHDTLPAWGWRILTQR
jgi:glycosidase